MNDQNNPQSTTVNDIPEETRAFLESLLEEVHMEYVDDKQKEEMLVQLYARLDYFLTAKIIDAIPDEDLEAFTKMNEEGKSREEVEAFIMEKVPNAQEQFKNAFIEFHDMYVGAARDMDAEETQNPVSAVSEDAPASVPPAPVMPMNESQPAEANAMSSSVSEDVPPPPPAPVPQSDDDNGSNPMVN